jgi:mono/diheme cytochrome c family protein
VIRPLGALRVVLGLGLVACTGGGPALDEPLQRMQEQPRYEPYGASTFFPDGQAMRHPPAGTVPVERVLRPDVDPHHPSAALLELGRDRYAIFCAPCHGAGAYGGSLVAVNLRENRPPSLRSESVRSAEPGELYRVITDGVGTMPSYAAELSVPERWAVVAYLKRLQRLPAVSPRERQDSVWAERIRTGGRANP